MIITQRPLLKNKPEKWLGVFIYVLTLSVFSVIATAEEEIKNINELAYQSFQKGNYKESYLQAKQAKQLAIQENNQQELARALANIASNLLYFGDTENALPMYLESLSVAEENADLDGIERAINNISAFYVHIGNSHEAVNYLQKLPVVNGIKRPTLSQIMAYAGLAGRYAEIGELSKAKKAQQDSERLIVIAPNDFINTYILQNKAMILSAEKKHREAIEIFLEAREVAEKHQFKGVISSSDDYLVKEYIKVGELDKAFQTAIKALTLAIELGFTDRERTLTGLLIKIERFRGNYAYALDYAERYQQLNESFISERVKQLAEINKIDRQFAETEEKLLKSEEKQKIIQLELERQQQQFYFAVLISMLLALTIIFGIYRKSSKQALANEKQLNSELLKLDKVKDQILANTSHELRTPLNGIIGLSQIILNDYQDKIEQSLIDSIKLIANSGQILSKRVDDILDLAQLKRGSIKFSPQLFELNETIKQVIDVCSPLTLGTEVNIHFDVSRHPVEVFQDLDRIQQVLFNLLGNAIKFTHQGDIRISMQSGEKNIVLQIDDTGIGVAEDKLERIFLGFEQADAGNDRTYQGAGLGLAISKEIAEGLNGELKLTSILGKGTQVIFTFPKNA